MLNGELLLSDITNVKSIVTVFIL